MFNNRIEIQKQSTWNLKNFFSRQSNEELAKRKLEKMRHSYTKERQKQREHFDEELARTNDLLKSESIDEETHERYHRLLKWGYNLQREETRKKFGLTESILAP